jgi:Zn-dependent protease with chaperone function
MTFDTKLKSPKEETLFPLAAIAAGLLWLLLVVGTCGMGLFYAAGIGGVILIAHALFLASVKGNGIRLSGHQLPELYARCKVAAERLGLEEVPEVYLLQSGGVLNAFATKLLSRKFVILYSSLVDECADPQQLDFVIGHELGHLAAGHLKWNAFLLPAKALPWLGAAYSRACEYTCDRCGFHVVGDLEPSVRALTVLAAGGRLSQQVDLKAFVAQREETGGFWMAVCELVSSHPYLCKRVGALQEWIHPGSVQPVARNPFAYLLAPIFGAGVGGGALSGVMVFVAVIGVMAALAIPNFMKFQERARAAQAHTQQRADDTAKLLQEFEASPEVQKALLEERARQEAPRGAEEAADEAPADPDAQPAQASGPAR